MKIRQITDSFNQHIVAIEKDSELRCFFKFHSLHTCNVAYDNLRRDIARHGESVIKFESFPKITSRIAKSGRIIYDVSESPRFYVYVGSSCNEWIDYDTLEEAVNNHPDEWVFDRETHEPVPSMKGI